MNIFLDVGSHDGQTLAEVIHPRYRFDIIHCFEPMPVQYTRLTQRFNAHSANKRIEFHHYGLLDRSTSLAMYGTNHDMGSSIFAHKQRMQGREQVTRCEFRRASDFFAENITDDDLVVMKINVEGSECIIMNDLINSGECHKIANVMIDFDIRKVPDKRNEEGLLLERFKREGFRNFCKCDDVMIGANHQQRIRHWLSSLEFAESFMDPGRVYKLKRLLEKIRSRLSHRSNHRTGPA
jgi:FkbM family methyltransferase